MPATGFRRDTRKRRTRRDGVRVGGRAWRSVLRVRPPTRSLARALVVLAAATALVSAGLGRPTTASAVTGPAVAAVTRIVSLGDSVPYGTRCGCRPFPQESALRLGWVNHRAVSTSNDSVPGETSAGVLQQLTSDRTVMRHVAAADVVELTIGANDVAFSTRCRYTKSCYVPALQRAKATVTRIVARIHALAPGRHVAVVITGYWNVWKDGSVAKAMGPAYVSTSRSVTLSLALELRDVATTSGAIWVDLWRVFRGGDDHDDTSLLAADGDHPNLEGQRRIAVSVVHALTSLLPDR